MELDTGWGFPYAASGLAPTPGRFDLIDNNLAQIVLGGGAYASIDNWLYIEADAYRGLSQNIRNGLGAVPVAGTDDYDGFIPYWRVALEHDFNGEHYFEVGTYGLACQPLSRRRSLRPA